VGLFGDWDRPDCSSCDYWSDEAKRKETKSVELAEQLKVVVQKHKLACKGCKCETIKKAVRVLKRWGFTE
jgi:hypothetical protein